MQQKAEQRVKALKAIDAILAENPEVLADINERHTENLADTIGSDLRVQEMVASHAKLLLDTMKPWRQNAPAIGVANQIAHLFRQLGLKPSAAKRGPDPSSIFGQCVSDVFLALGEKANWRRAAEAAVETGEQHMRDLDELMSVFAFLKAYSAENQ